MQPRTSTLLTLVVLACAVEDAQGAAPRPASDLPVDLPSHTPMDLALGSLDAELTRGPQLEPSWTLAPTRAPPGSLRLSGFRVQGGAPHYAFVPTSGDGEWSGASADGDPPRRVSPS